MVDYLSCYCNIFYYRDCYSGRTISCFFWAQIRRNILIAPILIALTIPFYQLMQQNVENKMIGEGSTSAQVRMFDLVQQLVLTVDNPITGVGLDDQVYKTQRSKYSLNVAQLDYESLRKGKF